MEGPPVARKKATPRRPAKRKTAASKARKSPRKPKARGKRTKRNTAKKTAKKNIAKAGVKGSVLFYTTVADSQEQLEYNVERIEKVAKDEGLRALGPTVEEGNLGKWYYEEDGRWQWAHIYWGIFGPEGTSLGTCLKCPTHQLPDYIKLYETWLNKNTQKIQEIGGGGANFIAFGVNPSYIDVTGGISVHSDPRYRELQHELWKDMIITQIKELGGIVGILRVKK